MALKHLKTALFISGIVCLAAPPQAHAADSLEVEDTNGGAPTNSVDGATGSSSDNHGFHNRSYGSYFHGEIPIKTDPMAYYWGPNVKSGSHSCTHDKSAKETQHGGDHGSNGQGQGYKTGYFYGCPDYTGDGPLMQGTWTNEPLEPPVWEQPKWTADSRSTGAFSDEYARGVPTYVSTSMNPQSPPQRPAAPAPQTAPVTAGPAVVAAPVVPVAADTAPLPLVAPPAH